MNNKLKEMFDDFLISFQNFKNPLPSYREAIKKDITISEEEYSRKMESERERFKAECQTKADEIKEFFRANVGQ